MRYTVDVGELSAAVEHLAAALRAKGFGVARRLEPVARALPGGATSAALQAVLERWRVRERLAWDAVAEHAGHLTATLEGYEQVEARAVEALGESP
jgi:hypothetical protein